MKWILLIHLFLVAVLYGRRELSSDPILPFVPGTYIHFSSYEYHNEYYTMVISIQNQPAHFYTILRRWKYERAGEQPVYHLTRTTGLYSAMSRTLEDMETGDLFSFDPGQKALFTGSAKFQKI